VAVDQVAARVAPRRQQAADQLKRRQGVTNRLPDLQTPRPAPEPARVADQVPEALKVLDQAVGPVAAAGVTFRTCLSAYR